MIVPKFWAEGRVRERVGKSQVTIRRFGWSNTSQQDAQSLADQRVQAAMARARAGEKIPRRDLKLAYNGSDGVPIREEIIAEHGDTVITRNLYGARCLNTPDVLFADVDIAYPRRLSFGCLFFLTSLATSIVVALITLSVPVGGAALGMCLLLSAAIISATNFIRDRKRPALEKTTQRNIEETLRQHPEWRICLYRTPAGFRLLALHRLFKADESETLRFFEALKVDPTYAFMCRHQQCFRARVSPKPWRAGIRHHIRPNRGVWPINPQHLRVRQEWIDAYESVSRSFASCRYLETFGSGATNAKAAAVKKLHDDLSRSASDLPIA